MAKPAKTAIRKRKFREYNYLGCPLTRNRTPWCFRLCAPNQDGRGRCGRIAPHSLKSAIQSGIEAQKKRQRGAHFLRLERIYLAAPVSKQYDPRVRVTDGAAEIAVEIRTKFLHAAGFVDTGICFKLLNDAAQLAVNSTIEGVFVTTALFNMYPARPVAAGALIARGRLMNVNGDQFLAEAALMDEEGNEIARGGGSFVRSAIPLPLDNRAL